MHIILEAVDKKESELVFRVVKREEAATRQFHAEYFPAVLRLVAEKIGDSRDAEEIAASVITDAMYSLPSFSGRVALWTWLRAITQHEIADFYRKKKIKEILFSFVPGLERIVNKALSAETAMEEREMKEKVLVCLAKISEGYRQILRLKYVDGLSVRQISRVIGAVSVKAAEMRLRRARAAFVYEWKKEKGNSRFRFGDSTRELSFLAQYLGFAVASVPDHPEDLG